MLQIYRFLATEAKSQHIATTIEEDVKLAKKTHTSTEYCHLYSEQFWICICQIKNNMDEAVAFIIFLFFILTFGFSHATWKTQK